VFGIKGKARDEDRKRQANGWQQRFTYLHGVAHVHNESQRGAISKRQFAAKRRQLRDTRS
jgi:hypothetical protein